MSKVVPLMDRRRALEQIRRLAADTGNIVFDREHASKRMIQRGITMKQVLEVIRYGQIVEGPFEDIRGGWRCTLERRVIGRDVIRVAVGFGRDARIYVITVI